MIRMLVYVPLGIIGAAATTVILLHLIELLIHLVWG